MAVFRTHISSTEKCYPGTYDRFKAPMGADESLGKSVPWVPHQAPCRARVIIGGEFNG